MYVSMKFSRKHLNIVLIVQRSSELSEEKCANIYFYLHCFDSLENKNLNSTQISNILPYFDILTWDYVYIFFFTKNWKENMNKATLLFSSNKISFLKF